MQASNTFKKTFLNLMLNGLQENNLHSDSMSIQQRKRAIKLYANASMAMARGPAKWSTALIEHMKKKKKKNTIDGNRCRMRIPTSKKIIRRSLRSRPRTKNVEASVVARRMVKKRTKVLKGIIPGGESLDGFSLLGETLDYVIHLKAQVNLMKCLARGFGSQDMGYCRREKSIGETPISVGNAPCQPCVLSRL